MRQLGWKIDLSKCIGCKACMEACKFENNTTLDLRVNYRWVTEVERGRFPQVQRVFVPLACNHCADPACKRSCPTHAITKRASDGIVLIDQEKCVGCQACVMACPYGAPQFNRVTKKVEKCTLCVHRIEAGLGPACAATCVGEAITFGEDFVRWGDPPPEFADPRQTRPSIQFVR
jgi:Fe-S-cluster-containing hydrogenase components 1